MEAQNTQYKNTVTKPYSLPNKCNKAKVKRKKEKEKTLFYNRSELFAPEFVILATLH
jgi:hypothetical protein